MKHRHLFTLRERIVHPHRLKRTRTQDADYRFWQRRFHRMRIQNAIRHQSPGGKRT